MKGPIARATYRTSVVLAMRLAVQAAALVLIARVLGPSGFGAFAGLAALALMLGMLGTFGTHYVLLAEVSRAPARRDAVLGYAVPTTLICGLFLLIVYLLACRLLLPETGVSVAVPIALGTAEAIVQPLLGLIVAEHMALGRTARSQLLQTLPLALRLGVAAAVLLLKASDPLLIFSIGYLASSIAGLAIGVATVPRPWPNPRTWRFPRPSELTAAAGYAAVNISATGPAELDKTLATRLLSLHASGLYAAGARVIGATTLPVIAMMLSALPRMFREGGDPTSNPRRLLLWIFGATIVYGFSLAACLWLLAPQIGALFGSHYTGLAEVIGWLCPIVPAMALRLAAGNVLMAMGKPWMRVAFEITGLLVLTGASLLVVPRLGMPGMALALACSEWTMAIIGLALVRATRRHQTEPALRFQGS